MPLTQVDQGLLGQYAQYTGFKNRIINPGMVIDQRNAGAAVNGIGVAGALYTLDRWLGWLANQSTANLTIQQSSVAPAGFTNSLAVTVTAAQASLGSGFYSMLWQKIEGFNVADLGWGTANAKSVAVSFWVRSNVTGQFGGSVLNSSQNRSYAFSYTINAANTWEQKTITIPGDTTGTWLTNSSTGLILSFGIALGSGSVGTANVWGTSAVYSATGQTNLYATNGNTWYITGVQLEVGSTATSFDYRPYGTELALCQRYYQKTYEYSVVPGAYGGNGTGYLQGRYITSYAYTEWYFKVDMRAVPTVTTYAPFDGTSGKCWIDSTGSANTVLGGGTGTKSILIACTTVNTNPFYFHAVASAEL